MHNKYYNQCQFYTSMPAKKAKLNPFESENSDEEPSAPTQPRGKSKGEVGVEKGEAAEDGSKVTAVGEAAGVALELPPVTPRGPPPGTPRSPGTAVPVDQRPANGQGSS